MTKADWAAEAVALLAVGAAMVAVGVLMASEALIVGGLLVLALADYCAFKAADPPQENYARIARLRFPESVALLVQNGVLPYPWCEVDREARNLLKLTVASLDAEERRQGARAAGDYDWALNHELVGMGIDAMLSSRLRSFADTLDDVVAFLRTTGVDADIGTVFTANPSLFDRAANQSGLLRRVVAEGGLASCRLERSARRIRSIAKGP